MRNTSYAIAIERPVQSLLLKLRDECSLGEISEYLDISQNRLSKFLNHGIVTGPALEKMINKLDLPLSAIADDKIDPSAAQMKIKKMHFHIPVKYMEDARTSRALSAAMLDALPLETKKAALRYLQTSEQCFRPANFSKKISTKFNYDLFRYLALHASYNQKMFDGVGLRIYEGLTRINKIDPVTNAAPSSVAANMFEQMLKHYEKNHFWEIVKSTQSELTVRKYLLEEIAYDLRSNGTNTNEICKYMMGLIRAAALNSLRVYLDIVETKCVFAGDDCCEYRLDLKNARRIDHLH